MRRASFIKACSVLTIAISVGATSPAYAQASATATAENLFNEGLAAMKRNDFVAACEAFTGSNEADPSPGTQINLALCNEKQGKLASAWGWYGTAASLANQRGQKERAELARAEAAKLEPKLHKLVISVKAPVDGMTVTRNGVKVPAAVLGREDPVDPGELVVEVNAPKKKAFQKKLFIAAGPGIDRVEVPALEDAPEDKAVVPPGPVGPVTEPPAGERSSTGSTQRGLGWITLGVGIASGIVAGVYGVFTVTQDDKRASEQARLDAENRKPNPDSAAVMELTRTTNDFRDKAISNRTGAIAFGVASGVLIAGGLVLLFTAPSATKTGQLEKKPTFTPLLGSGVYGAGLSTAF